MQKSCGPRALNKVVHSSVDVQPPSACCLDQFHAGPGRLPSMSQPLQSSAVRPHVFAIGYHECAAFSQPNRRLSLTCCFPLRITRRRVRLAEAGMMEAHEVVMELEGLPRRGLLRLRTCTQEDWTSSPRPLTAFHFKATYVSMGLQCRQKPRLPPPQTCQDHKVEPSLQRLELN